MTDPITTPAQMREAAALVERVAAAMWSAEAMRAAPNMGRTRTPERFADESDDTRRRWLCLAEAAIRALPVAEQQAIRDRALEDAAQCCDAEADRCDDAVKWGGQRRYIQDCKAAAYAMRDRAYAIRAMKGKPE